MTKLLILSDSHNSRLAIENILAAEADSIDALIFLGDGLRDLEQALTFYPSLRAYAVAGNCDFGALEPLDGLAAFDGVVVFYTHGHMYGVKYDLDTLADAAAARGANVASSVTPTSRWQKSGAVCSCSTLAPAAGATPAPTPTAS